jgi:hypothetical protein
LYVEFGFGGDPLGVYNMVVSDSHDEFVEEHNDPGYAARNEIDFDVSPLGDFMSMFLCPIVERICPTRE